MLKDITTKEEIKDDFAKVIEDISAETATVDDVDVHAIEEEQKKKEEPVIEAEQEPIKKPASEKAKQATAKFLCGLMETTAEAPLMLIAESKKKKRIKSIGGEEWESVYNGMLSKIDENNKPEQELNDIEKKMLNAHVKISRYVSSLPYSKDEKDEMIEYILLEIKDRDFQIPGWLMIASAFVINTTERIVKLMDI